MTGPPQTLGVVVKKYDGIEPSVTICCKKNVYDFPVAQLPSSVDIGDWVKCQLDKDGRQIEVVTHAKKRPMATRIYEGEVQMISYFTVPYGHASVRDDFIHKKGEKVWSPQLGWAYSDSHVMLNLIPEIIYLGWFAYYETSSENESNNCAGPIWELKFVGSPLIDPATTILLQETPWKIASRVPESTSDTSLSRVLNDDKPDGYHNGLVVALINRPEPGVILYSRSCNGFVSSDSKEQDKGMYDKLRVGQAVKFYYFTDESTGMTYPYIKKILNTTDQDIHFEVVEDSYHSCIMLQTCIEIDDDLVKEDEKETVSILCDYGIIIVDKGRFAGRMEAVLLDYDDLVEAKNDGKKLIVWIQYVPVSSTWRIEKIDEDYYEKRTGAVCK